MNQPFATRRVILVGEVQRDAAIALLSNVPLGLEVLIRTPVKVRGLDQNGYYFMRIGEIAGQAWIDGKQFSKDAWHVYAKKNLLPEEITTKDGEVRSKWELTPDGDMSVISTTRLERGCFAEYTNAVEAFGASLGVMFSASRDERKAA